VSQHSFAGKVAIAGIGATSSRRTRAARTAPGGRSGGWRPRRRRYRAHRGGRHGHLQLETNPDVDIARSLGIGELTFFSRIHYGGGAACATIQQAALAVASGVADVVVCYRAFNERSGNRFGAGVQDRAPMANAESAHFAFYMPVAC